MPEVVASCSGPFDRLRRILGRGDVARGRPRAIITLAVNDIVIHGHDRTPLRVERRLLGGSIGTSAAPSRPRRFTAEPAGVASP